MSVSLRRIRRSTRFVAVATALVAGSLAVVWTASSAASGAPRAVHPHSTSPIPLSHFLCYAAKGPNFAKPSGVKLWTQLNTTTFTPSFGAVDLHCNPAEKQVTNSAGKTTTFPILNPNSHLLCWSIQGPAPDPRTVVLKNQFGSATMLALPPNQLCVPTWKAKKPPNEKVVDPPNLDHFTCYPLHILGSSYDFAPPATKVLDEFSTPALQSIKVGIANELCVPTLKILASGASYPPYTPNDQSLVCYPSTPTKYWTSAWDQDQFGQAQVFLSAKPEELCLPTTEAPATPPPPLPLDHFLCYQATAAGFAPPPAVSLQQALIHPAAFGAKVQPAFLHCNPVAKYVGPYLHWTAVYPINNPVAHLVCFQVTGPVGKTSVKVLNQFTPSGAATVTIRQPDALCLPTWKQRTAPPNQPAPQPPGLDHFLCYPITSSTAYHGPASVYVQDEFNAPHLTGIKIGSPVLVCGPATKTVASAGGLTTYAPFSPNDKGLECYDVHQLAPPWPSFYDQNQFGTARVVPSLHYQLLCLPSTLS